MVDVVRALVVEADPTAQAALVIQLNRADGIAVIGGYQPGDPRLTNSLLADVDVVVISVGSRDRGGLELCRRLKLERPDLGCVMLVPSVDDEMRAAGREVGVDRWVLKQLDLGPTATAIRAVHHRAG